MQNFINLFKLKTFIIIELKWSIDWLIEGIRWYKWNLFRFFVFFLFKCKDCSEARDGDDQQRQPTARWRRICECVCAFLNRQKKKPRTQC